MPKVSVIVPVYNPKEEYLKTCVNSIINQTFKDIEIILVDNESTGDNPNILKEYGKQDNRIKLIVFEENKGFAGAVNAGLKIARGEYIAIIDSDDWLELHTIQVLTDKLDNSDLDMTIYCANTFDEKLQKFTNDPLFTFYQIPSEYNESYFNFSRIKDFILGFPAQAWNKFYRRSFIIDNNNFIDEELGSAGADALFTFYNCVNAKKIGIVRELLYNYRVNVGGGVVNSLKLKNSKDYLMNMKLFKKIEDLIVDKSLDNETSLPFAYINIMQLFYFFTLIHKSNRHAYYNEMRKLLKNLNPEIYSVEQFPKYDNRVCSWIKHVRKDNYYMYKIKRFLAKLHIIRYVCPVCMYILFASNMLLQKIN